MAYRAKSWYSTSCVAYIWCWYADLLQKFSDITRTYWNKLTYKEK